MAIIKCGGGVVGIRGQLGGNIFSSGTNGPYVRTWANIPNPCTQNQFFRRFPFQAWPGVWAAISAGQRADWNAYGKAHPKTNPLLETYHLNGYQWFVSCNQRLTAWSGTEVHDAPVNPPPTTVTCTAVDYAPDGLIADIDIQHVADAFADNFRVIHAYVIPWGTNTSWPSAYYQMRVDFDPDPGETLVNFALAHNIKFGPGAVGYKMFVRVMAGSIEGLASIPWESQATWPTA